MYEWSGSRWHYQQTTDPWRQRSHRRQSLISCYHLPCAAVTTTTGSFTPWCCPSKTFAVFFSGDHLPPFLLVLFSKVYQVGKHGRITIACDAWWLTIRYPDLRPGDSIVKRDVFLCLMFTSRFRPVSLAVSILLQIHYRCHSQLYQIYIFMNTLTLSVYLITQMLENCGTKLCKAKSDYADRGYFLSSPTSISISMKTRQLGAVEGHSDSGGLRNL